MTQMFLLMMLTMNSLFFFLMNHPLTMGFLLLIQTTLICLYMMSMSSMSWFCYMLFLIFIGGMLILFMYMSSLTPNEKISFNIYKSNSMIYMIFTILMMILLIDKFYMNFLFNNQENNTLTPNLLINTIWIPLSKMYNNPNNFITILLVLYLLLTLIVVVKVTSSFLGPMRLKT